jgi:hypothetical protein
LTEIAAIYCDPTLEKIAIHALDDTDAGTAADAATMLGKFGSVTAQAPLRRRYKKWSRRWAGHEPEINLSQAEYDLENPRLAQRGFGSSLFEALATGQAWLMDPAELRRLAGLNKVPSIVEQAQRHIELYKQPLTLSISCSPLFHAHLAPYTFRSIDGLKQKLLQFPAGTKFLLWWPSVEEQNQSCIADVRAFLKDHGMSLQDEEKPAGD